MSQAARKKGEGTSPRGATDGDAPQLPVCFVMMPISDPDGYDPGHFRHVYEGIFRPACEKAGYRAIRADEVQQTNLIHEDMLRLLLESPMALCDLSTRNPNVLFELGLRQAFDKPVVLVQEVHTRAIFDIAGLRYTVYRPALLYHEVLEDQATIATAIKATREAADEGKGINSIVRLLSLTPATLPEVKEANQDPLLQLIRAELSSIRSEFQAALGHREGIPPPPHTGAAPRARDTQQAGTHRRVGDTTLRSEAREIVLQSLEKGQSEETIIQRLTRALDVPPLTARQLLTNTLVDNIVTGTPRMVIQQEAHKATTVEDAETGQADEGLPSRER